MSSLPPTLDFAAAEEEICKKWSEEETFKTQDKLSVAVLASYLEGFNSLT
jgi:hypothetical protein